jgi:hypothetical protein
MLKNKILEDIRLKMSNDPWHIKMLRQIRFKFWLIYCFLFNNKFCRILKYKYHEKI